MFLVVDYDWLGGTPQALTGTPLQLSISQGCKFLGISQGNFFVTIFEHFLYVRLKEMLSVSSFIYPSMLSYHQSTLKRYDRIVSIKRKSTQAKSCTKWGCIGQSVTKSVAHTLQSQRPYSFLIFAEKLPVHQSTTCGGALSSPDTQSSQTSPKSNYVFVVFQQLFREQYNCLLSHKI